MSSKCIHRCIPINTYIHAYMHTYRLTDKQNLNMKNCFELFGFNYYVYLFVSGFRDCPSCSGSYRVVGSGHVPCILLCKVNNLFKTLPRIGIVPLISIVPVRLVTQQYVSILYNFFFTLRRRKIKRQKSQSHESENRSEPRTDRPKVQRSSIFLHVLLCICH